MDIIPGLPNEIAFECLIRVPFSKLQSLRSVCKAWKSKLPEFLRLRKSAGKAQSLFVFARVSVSLKSDFIVFEPETGLWSEMPPIPNGMPQFCGIAGVGSELVVIGGLNRKAKSFVDSVFTFNFLSSTWSCGVNIPDGCRSTFACATDGDRTVFVAGGYQNKNSLKSAWTYDVPTNTWNRLPDMAKKRVWCIGLFHLGKLSVFDICYEPPNPNDYNNTLSVFDVSSRKWSEICNMFPHALHSRSYCAVGSDQKIYSWHDHKNIHVLEDHDHKYKFVAKIPTDMTNPEYMFFSLGCLWLKGQSNNPNTGGRDGHLYKLDMKQLIWTKLTTPVKFYGWVKFGCCLSL